ncbi:hypothetical protein RRG08_006702 [Elysia crispata]|uniref:Secreted protein n=1 Tax=Elysia crispata TaxID=231223 RepID=A0AAE0YXN6_9GAST|nr:hypothetical protein RRG08_006702 [Elysia crispata]
MKIFSGKKVIQPSFHCKGLVLWTLLGLALVMLNLPEVAPERECDASLCPWCRPYRGHARCRCVVAYCSFGRRRRQADIDNFINLETTE